MKSTHGSNIQLIKMLHFVMLAAFLPLALVATHLQNLVSLEKHNSTSIHRQAMLAWNEYKVNSQRGLTIENRLDSARNLQIQRNRHYLTTVSEVVLLCATQDIAFRGHRESQSSMNRGNFLEILHLVACHDESVKAKLVSGPRNAIYTSPDIQNSLLNIMAGMVRENICNAVREAGFFFTVS